MFVAAHAVQINTVAIQLYPTQFGIFQDAHIMDSRYQRALVLTAITDHVQEQNLLQTIGHAHVHLHLRQAVIAEHAQEQKVLLTQDLALVHKLQHIHQHVEMAHALELIVIRLREAVHVQLIMQEK